MPKKITKGNMKNPEKFLGTMISHLIIEENKSPRNGKLNSITSLVETLPNSSNRFNMTEIVLDLPNISQLINKQELNKLRSQLIKNLQQKHDEALRNAQKAHFQEITALKEAQILGKLVKNISEENVHMKEPEKRVVKRQVEKKRFKPYPGAPRKKK